MSVKVSDVIDYQNEQQIHMAAGQVNDNNKIEQHKAELLHIVLVNSLLP